MVGLTEQEKEAVAQLGPTDHATYLSRRCAAEGDFKTRISEALQVSLRILPRDAPSSAPALRAPMPRRATFIRSATHVSRRSLLPSS